MKNVYFLMLLLALSQTAFAQTFELSTEIRPRFEYRHGFKTLIPDDVDAALFVSQRSRLNFNYGNEKLKAYISLQNVRVWGEVNTLSESDDNGTAIHEAWASVLLDSKFELKMGRQEIVYDDSRIFGNVDWAQTGRSHDALIVTFKPNDKNRLDVGIALNEEDETLFQTDYDVNNYKAFQYAWYHSSFNDVALSLLVLNTGFTFDNDGEQDVDYNQTIGAHITYEKSKLIADVSAYFQTGKIANTDLSALNLAGNVHYDITSSFNAGLGAEYLSGTDMNTTDVKLKSFNPLFGTNHKFNGWMDYFYVGNHINNVGLLDLNLPLKYQKEKITLLLVPHLFSSAATVVDMMGNEMDTTLGTEIDVSFGYKIADNINFQVGYSHMFATDTMEVIKGGNKDNTNNWAWVMISIKPSLFKSTIQKN
jgi:hypothetical protein